jgi:hypothetical protein
MIMHNMKEIVLSLAIAAGFDYYIRAITILNSENKFVLTPFFRTSLSEMIAAKSGSFSFGGTL